MYGLLVPRGMNSSISLGGRGEGETEDSGVYECLLGRWVTGTVSTHIPCGAELHNVQINATENSSIG